MLLKYLLLIFFNKRLQSYLLIKINFDFNFLCLNILVSHQLLYVYLFGLALCLSLFTWTHMAGSYLSLWSLIAKPEHVGFKDLEC